MFTDEQLLRAVTHLDLDATILRMQGNRESSEALREVSATISKLPALLRALHEETAKQQRMNCSQYGASEMLAGKIRECRQPRFEECLDTARSLVERAEPEHIDSGLEQPA